MHDDDASTIFFGSDSNFSCYTVEMIEVPSLTFVHSFQFISSQCKFLGRYSKFSFIPILKFLGEIYGSHNFGLLQKGGGEGGILGSQKEVFLGSLLQFFFDYFRDAIRTSRKIHIK